MSELRFILHAPNVHCGGGLTLLKALISVLPERSCLIVDERLPISVDILERFQVEWVKPTVWHRLAAEYQLTQLVKQRDVVLCFGNLPPLFHLKGQVSLFLQNRYLIDMVSLNHFPLKLRFRIMAERIWFRFFRSRASQIIVQSSSMNDLLEANFMMSANILPFIECANEYSIGEGVVTDEQKLYDFIYVASGEPHKNHFNLIKAWIKLAIEDVRPSLYLTLNKDFSPELISWIEEEKAKYNLNIHNLGSLSGGEVIGLYRKANALIFPSTLESFGLPLIEAKGMGLAIVASELDYVRDVVDPDESFSPNSPVSIARAVKRFLGKKENRSEPIDAKSFLQHLFKE
jgi:glycosyltransferase involved in cell wall biosynthesis